MIFARINFQTLIQHYLHHPKREGFVQRILILYCLR